MSKMKFFWFVLGLPCVSVGLPSVCMCVGRSAFCVHVCWSVCLLCTCVLVGLPSVCMCVGRSAFCCVCMCVGRSAFCVHVCWSVCLLCACVLVGLPCVCMCVGRSAFCVHVCRSVCLLCACVSVGLPSVCMCVGRSAFCVHVCRSVCLVCACVLVGLPSVCMCVGRSAFCVHVCWSVCLVCACVSVGLPSVCMCVGRSALCVHVCWSVCLLCACVLVGLPSVCMCVGRSAFCVHVCWSVCLVCACVLVGLICAELVWTLDNQISREYRRIDTIFPESQLKKDMFFPDRLVERSIIFQTAKTIKHPFSHGTFQSHGYGFTSHLFHVVVKNRAKWNVKTSESQTFNKHWIHRTFCILNKIQGCIIFSSNFQTKFRKHSKLQTISRLLNFQTILPDVPTLLCVHMCRSVCLVCACMLVGRSALCVGRSALCVGRSACWCRLCKLCKFIWNKIEPNCSSSFAWGGRECHFLFSSAPLKYWKASCSKLAPPPPPPPPHTHTQYNTTHHNTRSIIIVINVLKIMCVNRETFWYLTVGSPEFYILYCQSWKYTWV